MRKKFAALLFLTCLLQLVVVCYLLYEGEKPMVGAPVKTAEIETVWKIEDTHKAQEEIEGFTLYAEDVCLPYDRTTHTFYWPLPLNSADWPETQIDVSRDLRVQAYWVDDYTWDDKNTAVAEGTRYEIIACDSEKYAYYGLVFTGMPSLSVETQTDEIDQERAPAYVRIYDPDRDHYIETESEIRLRGTTAQFSGALKQSYRFWMTKPGHGGKLGERSESLLGMRTNDSWNLLAIYADESLMREKAGMDIWHGFGAGGGENFCDFSGEYVEVFVNNEYQGVYLLGETIDKKALTSRNRTSYFQQDYLYRGVLAWVDWAFRYPIFPDPVVWETDRFGYHLRYPEYKNGIVPEEAWEPLKEFLTLQDTMDAQSLQNRAPDVLDVPGIVDYWLFLQALALTDNDGNNLNIWAHDTNRGYIYSIFPWDLSNSWGGISNTNRIGALMDDWLWEEKPEMLFTYFGGRIHFRLGDRLLAVNAANSREYAMKRWMQLRKSVLSEDAIETQITGYAHRLNDSGAAVRNFARWKSDGSYVNLCEDMTLWLQVRCGLLDEYFEHINWEELWSQRVAEDEV